MLHIFCVRFNSQLREICDKEKQQFWPDSLPLNINNAKKLLTNWRITFDNFFLFQMNLPVSINTFEFSYYFANFHLFLNRKKNQKIHMISEKFFRIDMNFMQSYFSYFQKIFRLFFLLMT